jgi:hypothetical protein
VEFLAQNLSQTKVRRQSPLPLLPAALSLRIFASVVHRRKSVDANFTLGATVIFLTSIYLMIRAFDKCAGEPGDLQDVILQISQPNTKGYVPSLEWFELAQGSGWFIAKADAPCQEVPVIPLFRQGLGPALASRLKDL